MTSSKWDWWPINTFGIAPEDKRDSNCSDLSLEVEFIPGPNLIKLLGTYLGT